jgi:hypothetical protein
MIRLIWRLKLLWAFDPSMGMIIYTLVLIQTLTGAGVRDDFQVFYQATWATFWAQ